MVIELDETIALLHEENKEEVALFSNESVGNRKNSSCQTNASKWNCNGKIGLYSGLASQEVEKLVKGTK